MNTAQYAVKLALPPHAAENASASIKQLSLELRDYLKALKAAWNEPLASSGRLSRELEQQFQKAYRSSGIEGVDSFVDKINDSLKSMGFDAGIGRGVACELKDGAADRLHFFFQEFNSQYIIGRYSFSV